MNCCYAFVLLISNRFDEAKWCYVQFYELFILVRRFVVVILKEVSDATTTIGIYIYV